MKLWTQRSTSKNIVCINTCYCCENQKHFLSLSLSFFCQLLLSIIKLATLPRWMNIYWAQSQPTQVNSKVTACKMLKWKRNEAKIQTLPALLRTWHVCVCVHEAWHICRAISVIYGCLFTNEVNSITIAQRSKWNNKHYYKFHFCYVQCALLHNNTTSNRNKLKPTMIAFSHFEEKEVRCNISRLDSAKLE